MLADVKRQRLLEVVALLLPFLFFVLLFACSSFAAVEFCLTLLHLAVINVATARCNRNFTNYNPSGVSQHCWNDSMCR